MAPTLYKIDASPAVRSVLITAKALNLTLNTRDIDFFNGEHLQPFYLKLNPLHTMPTLDDDGAVLCDSHAIDAYLVEKYGQDDALYPKDVYRRALVNQKLAFNLGVIFPILRDIDFAYVKGEIKSLPEKEAGQLKNAYDFLETFLKDSDWIALDTISLADIHCYTTVSALGVHLKIEENVYPNITKWMNRCKNLPYFSEDAARLKMFEDIFKGYMS